MSELLRQRHKLTVLSQTNQTWCCECPVCGGTKLKLVVEGKRAGAFKCWTSDCTSAEIYKSLDIERKPYNPDYEQNLNYVPDSYSKLSGLILSVSLPKTLKPLTSVSSSGLPSSKQLPNGTVHYIYSPSQICIRTQMQDGSKTVRPYSRQEDGTWRFNAGSQKWTLYNERQLLNRSKQDGNAVIMAEGEKVAEFVQNTLGFVCITLPGWQWNLNHIVPALHRLQYLNEHLEALIYLPDYDETGAKKESLVRTSCALASIAFKSIPMTAFVPTPERGDDVADYPNLITSELFNRALIDD